MQWTAPTARIAMCQSAVVFDEWLESAVGYQRKSGPCRYNGEFTPDTGHQVTNVGNRPADFRV